MKVLKTYEDDLKIKKALLDFKDRKNCEKVTRDFFYRECYPNFKFVYDNYYTDCTSVIEFISEMYKLVMTPGVKSGKRPMENYRGESSLKTWLQTVSIKYCNKCFKKKQLMPIYEPLKHANEENDLDGDREESIYGTNNLDISDINTADVNKIISLMPNKRYGEIIKLFYVDGETNDSAAEILGMTKANFYNKKILAEAQYMRILKKEERHG